MGVKFGTEEGTETMRRNYASDPQKLSSCKTVLEVLYHHAKFGGARISPAAGVAKTFRFLSVCLYISLSVTLLNVTGCAPNFAMKALDYTNDFDAIG